MALSLQSWMRYTQEPGSGPAPAAAAAPEVRLRHTLLAQGVAAAACLAFVARMLATPVAGTRERHPQAGTAAVMLPLRGPLLLAAIALAALLWQRWSRRQGDGRTAARSLDAAAAAASAPCPSAAAARSAATEASQGPHRAAGAGNMIVAPAVTAQHAARDAPHGTQREQQPPPGARLDAKAGGAKGHNRVPVVAPGSAAAAAAPGIAARGVPRPGGNRRLYRGCLAASRLAAATPLAAAPATRPPAAGGSAPATAAAGAGSSNSGASVLLLSSDGQRPVQQGQESEEVLRAGAAAVTATPAGGRGSVPLRVVAMPPRRLAAITAAAAAEAGCGCSSAGSTGSSALHDADFSSLPSCSTCGSCSCSSSGSCGGGSGSSSGRGSAGSGSSLSQRSSVHLLAQEVELLQAAAGAGAAGAVAVAVALRELSPLASRPLDEEGYADVDAESGLLSPRLLDCMLHTSAAAASAGPGAARRPSAASGDGTASAVAAAGGAAVARSAAGPDAGDRMLTRFVRHHHHHHQQQQEQQQQQQQQETQQETQKVQGQVRQQTQQPRSPACTGSQPPQPAGSPGAAGSGPRAYSPRTALQTMRIKISGGAEPEMIPPGYEQRVATVTAAAGLRLEGVCVRRGCIEVTIDATAWPAAALAACTLSHPPRVSGSLSAQRLRAADVVSVLQLPKRGGGGGGYPVEVLSEPVTAVAAGKAAAAAIEGIRRSGDGRDVRRPLAAADQSPVWRLEQPPPAAPPPPRAALLDAQPYVIGLQQPTAAALDVAPAPPHDDLAAVLTGLLPGAAAAAAPPQCVTLAVLAWSSDGAVPELTARFRGVSLPLTAHLVPCDPPSPVQLQPQPQPQPQPQLQPQPDQQLHLEPQSQPQLPANEVRPALQHGPATGEDRATTTATAAAGTTATVMETAAVMAAVSATLTSDSDNDGDGDEEGSVHGGALGLGVGGRSTCSVLLSGSGGVSAADGPLHGGYFFTGGVTVTLPLPGPTPPAPGLLLLEARPAGSTSAGANSYSGSGGGGGGGGSGSLEAAASALLMAAAPPQSSSSSAPLPLPPPQSLAPSPLDSEPVFVLCLDDVDVAGELQALLAGLVGLEGAELSGAGAGGNVAAGAGSRVVGSAEFLEQVDGLLCDLSVFFSRAAAVLAPAPAAAAAVPAGAAGRTAAPPVPVPVPELRRIIELGEHLASWLQQLLPHPDPDPQQASEADGQQQQQQRQQQQHRPGSPVASGGLAATMRRMRRDLRGLRQRLAEAEQGAEAQAEAEQEAAAQAEEAAVQVWESEAGAEARAPGDGGTQAAAEAAIVAAAVEEAGAVAEAEDEAEAVAAMAEAMDVWKAADNADAAAAAKDAGPEAASVKSVEGPTFQHRHPQFHGTPGVAPAGAAPTASASAAAAAPPAPPQPRSATSLAAAARRLPGAWVAASAALSEPGYQAYLTEYCAWQCPVTDGMGILCVGGLLARTWSEPGWAERPLGALLLHGAPCLLTLASSAVTCGAAPFMHRQQWAQLVRRCMVPRYMSFCLGLVLGTLYEAVLGLDLPPAIVAYHARLPDVIMGEAVVLWLTMVVMPPTAFLMAAVRIPAHFAMWRTVGTHASAARAAADALLLAAISVAVNAAMHVVLYAQYRRRMRRQLRGQGGRAAAAAGVAARAREELHGLEQQGPAGSGAAASPVREKTE